MSDSKFNPYKVDYLFLLIGENPLPNYVAAKLLLETGGNVYLVYTNGTDCQATQLQRILDDELEGCQPCQLISLEDYESDAYRIQRKIREWVEKLREGSIGINYTGGTKAMAVHSYRAALQVCQERNQKVCFSYLDPRKLRMCFDRQEGESKTIRISPEDLEVKLETIFDLHSWKWLSTPSNKPLHPNAAEEFAKFHTQEEMGRLWRRWCDNTLRTKTRKGSGWHGEEELKKVEPLTLELLNGCMEIKAALSTLGVADDMLSLQSLKNSGFVKIKHICKWLDGEWLEHYVLQKVREISNSKNIYESATSFDMAVSNSKHNKFEFDVAFTRGYQLFAISCTTISFKSDCKQKLFEAFIRARQLGGDEARVALACCASGKDVAALRTEITNVFQSNLNASEQKNSKIIVFGREDLLNLSDKIAEWIDDNDQEAAK